MICAATCLCRCQQQGCGCHRASKTTSAVAVGDRRPNATCRMCNSGAHGYTIRSDAGNPVLVIWCPKCDVAKPR